MASLANNIYQAIADFNSIRQALIRRGIDIPEGTKTSAYASYIDNIELTVLDYSEPIHWLSIAGFDLAQINTDITLGQIFSTNYYNLLLNNEGGAAYAAFCSNNIAKIIKENATYLAEALTCNYKEWFVISSKNFLENIDILTERNPYVTEETANIVQCSSEQPEYRAYYAFDNSIDENSINATYRDRHIWVGFGENQWLQYNYAEPKKLYSLKVYSVRDNAPTHITILGTNADSPTQEDFTEIASQTLSGTKGSDYYDIVPCVCNTAYKTYRFVIRNSIRDEELNLPLKICTVGEIIIYTFKED